MIDKTSFSEPASQHLEFNDHKDNTLFKGKGFDPDKRIENEDRHNDGASEYYDPDKRVDLKEQEDPQKLINDYVEDVKKHSEFQDTLKDVDIKPSDIRVPSLEEMRDKLQEFAKKRDQLRREWEELTGKEWPKYKEDLYVDVNGKRVLLHKKGDNYDAHHIQPLGLGGKNEATNITPLSADVHYDARGVHAKDSPYRTLVSSVGGR